MSSLLQKYTVKIKEPQALKINQNKSQDPNFIDIVLCLTEWCPTNRTLKKMLRCFASDHPSNWEDHFPFLMMSYRSSIHSSTNCSPNLLVYGCENRLPIDVMFSDIALRAPIPECPHEYTE